VFPAANARHHWADWAFKSRDAIVAPPLAKSNMLRGERGEACLRFSVALLQIPEPTACSTILLSLRWASTENATFKRGSFGRQTSSKEVAKRATGKLQRRKVHPRQLTLTSVGAARRRFRVRSLEFHRQR
ncbi:unnamed protein product, partial [Ixodes pacificus]